VVLVSQRATPGLFDPSDALHRYTFDQLYRQVGLVGGFKPMTRPDQDDVRRAIVIVMERTGQAIGACESEPAGRNLACAGRPV
jgi:hypothetical protein